MKIFLILAMAIFSNMAAQAQKNYIPLKEFQGDTLKYMIVNFVENKERYIGQKVDSLLNDLEFEISTTFWPTGDIMDGNIWPPAEEMDRWKTKGLKFSYINHHQIKKMRNEGRIEYYILYIQFNIHYSKVRKDWDKIKGTYWKKAYRDFVKDYIIENIKLEKITVDIFTIIENFNLSNGHI